MSGSLAAFGEFGRCAVDVKYPALKLVVLNVGFLPQRFQHRAAVERDAQRASHVRVQPGRRAVAQEFQTPTPQRRVPAPGFEK